MLSANSLTIYVLFGVKYRNMFCILGRKKIVEATAPHTRTHTNTTGHIGEKKTKMKLRITEKCNVCVVHTVYLAAGKTQFTLRSILVSQMVSPHRISLSRSH